MQNTKEVIVTTRINKETVNQLKVLAKEKQLRFSSYIKRILVNQVEKQKKEKQN